MEANSIMPGKSGPRPASQQAQGELGGIFQEMLRESSHRFDMAAEPNQADVRPDRTPHRRDAVSAPARPSRDDRPSGSYDDTRDLTSEAAAVSDPRQVPASEETVKAVVEDTARRSENQPTARTDSPKPDVPPADSAQPSGTESAVAAGSAISGTGEGPTAGPAEAGAAQAIAQAAWGAAIRASDTPGKTQLTQVINSPASASTAQPATPVPPLGSAASPSNQATTSQSSNATPGAAGATQPAASLGANGVAAQVSITPPPLTAPPAATLGGAAAAAAMADPTSSQPAGAERVSVSGTPTAAPGSANQNSASAAANSAGGPIAGKGPATVLNTLAPVANGQTANAQSAHSTTAAGNTAASSAPTPQSAGAQHSPVPGTAANTTAPAGDADGADITPARPTVAQPARSRALGESVTGTTKPEGDGTPKSAQSNAADSRAVASSRPDLSPNGQTAAQTTAATAPFASQGAQATLGQSIGQPDSGIEAKLARGNAGRAEVTGNQAQATPSTIAGGFTQAFKIADAGAHSRISAGNPVPTDQVAIEIQKAVAAGKDHVRMRLHPAELGQIDVSLKVRHDGMIRVVVTADRPETFDLLQRDFRGLERALQDAGVKTDSGSLSFNLRGGEHHGPNDGQRGNGNTSQAHQEPDHDPEMIVAEGEAPPPPSSSHALDIRV